MNKELNDYIDAHFEDMKKTLTELVSYPSVSGKREGKYPFGEECAKAVDAFVRIADEMGFSARNYDYYAASADLGENPELGILGHLDVVPVCEKDWTYAPFSVTEKDGKLYGRGCIDDKGPVVAALYAMKAIKDLGIPLKKGVRLIIGSTEETGSEEDIHYYCKCDRMPPMVFTPDGDFPIITTEKGMIHFDFTRKVNCINLKSLRAGTVINAVPNEATAEVIGISYFPESESIHAETSENVTTITASGVAAHASKPKEGSNAITLLLEYLRCLKLEKEDEKLIDDLLRFFPHDETNGHSFGIDRGEGDEETTCVFSIAKLEGGFFSGSCDIRPEAGMISSEICALLKKAMKNFDLKFSLVNETHKVDTGSDFVRTLLNVYEEVSGLEPYCKTIGGETYVHGIDGGVAFGAEFPGENNNMHAADEYIMAKSLVLSTKIYSQAIYNICR